MNLFVRSGFYRKAALAVKMLLRSLRRSETLLVFGTGTGIVRPSIERVLIINLDRQPSRWKFFAREARRLRLGCGQTLFDYCERLPAVDAKSAIFPSDLESVNPCYTLEAQFRVDPDPRLVPRMREGEVRIRMTEQEVAVALSHLKAWRKMVDENIPYALVMEDDVFFEPNFAEQLNRSWRALPVARIGASRFDALYLSYREVASGARRQSVSPELVRVSGGYWWLSGYVLSQAGARKLIDSLPITGPVDLWFNLQFSRMEILSTPTSIISQRVDLPSDNAYSILPILSQLGVQSDRTHLLLERTKGRHPVFALGFPQRCAAWLDLALSLLGYRCCHDSAGRFEGNIKRLIETDAPLLFDAYVNVSPITDAFQKLDGLYPDAVFLVPNAHLCGSLPPGKYTAIRTHFLSRSEKCVTVDTGPKAWHQLCKALQCEIPKHMPLAAPDPVELPATDLGQVIPLQPRRHEPMQHDVHPWIVPKERLAAFGVQTRQRGHGRRRGGFTVILGDRWKTFDESQWRALEDTFPSNQATFSRENMVCGPLGCSLHLTKQKRRTRPYTAASFASRESFRFGRYETAIKAVRLPGVITAFFLHRTDPWQEIDLEILGRDTTRMLTNVYFNPGTPGTAFNYGSRGAPVLVDLGFDAAQDFHNYAIEWEPEEIRWFVDGDLVHVRGVWEPTPVPNLPMLLHCSVWPPRSAELAGELSEAGLPAVCEVRETTVSRWDTMAITDQSKPRSVHTMSSLNKLNR